MALMWRAGAPPPPKQAKAKAAPKDDDEGMPDLIDEGLDVLETADMPGLARASSGESGKSPTLLALSYLFDNIGYVLLCQEARCVCS